MFNIGWGEFLIIGIIALLVIGPKELPTVLRTIGQWMTKLRRMASEFQGQFQEAMREAEMADLKKQVDDVTAQAKGYADFDPIGDVRKEIESTQQQIESTFTDKPADVPGASTPATVESSVASSAPASAEATPASTEPVVAANVEAPFNVDAPVATPAPAPAPPELEGVGAAAAPVRPDAGGKPA